MYRLLKIIKKKIYMPLAAKKISIITKTKQQKKNFNRKGKKRKIKKCDLII